ncbi:MAG: undecaprenyl-diphosphatase UppP [Candidatus Melainabacteria bacterium LEY3_CP_29_8]|nr:MAG: undecaprenyl-diphosphatase UppP [Candidatus Melainabacteria bacterium LEY3_CP_29_8]
MTYLQCLLVSIAQGLTEFLPVSSSAHIVIVNALYKFFTHKDLSGDSPEEIFFAIIIHLGTLIAVLLYFKNDIIKIIKDFFSIFKDKKIENEDQKLSLYILLGTIVTVAFCFPLKDIVENIMKEPYITSIFLIGTGFILFFAEYLSKKNKNNNDNLSWKKAALIGLAQGLAIFPGFSRSGLTISTGLMTGLTRVKAAKFSFLLSIPIIIGASLFYPILELDFAQLQTFNLKALILGFLVSFIVGYLCIKYFMKFLGKYSLKVFAYYCLIVGIITFILFKFF